MQNVKHTIKDGILTIEVDLDANYGPSKTGKTLVVGSTQGFCHLDGENEGVMFSLNVNRRAVNV